MSRDKIFIPAEILDGKIEAELNALRVENARLKEEQGALLEQHILQVTKDRSDITFYQAENARLLEDYSDQRLALESAQRGYRELRQLLVDLISSVEHYSEIGLIENYTCIGGLSDVLDKARAAIHKGDKV